ncbi:hypothetical protein CSB09_04185 [Candidatus Gracilibacteria bacterium]|nr:MAG: hypothetical protein CSB09_04185 [Candidatus Gracilibacteria bacterium]
MPNIIYFYRIKSNILIDFLGLFSILDAMFGSKKYKDFGLALGGGVARGIAHIGLIQCLEEYKIQPKMVTGTSMGAIIGALWALGVSSQEMKKISKELGILKVINFNPFTDLISRSSVQKILDPYIGNATFDETKIPLKIVATNLATGNAHIFSGGKIMDAIFASIALPGVFSPFSLDGEQYVDGGVVENLPLSPIHDLPILAASVIVPKEHNISQESFLTRGFSLLYNLYNIMLQNQESLHIKLQKNPVHLVSLESSDVGYMDFGKTEHIIQEMYQISKSIDFFLHIPKKSIFFGRTKK